MYCPRGNTCHLRPLGHITSHPRSSSHPFNFAPCTISHLWSAKLWRPINLDAFFITETWLDTNNFLTLHEGSPPTYSSLRTVRPDKRGGEVAAIFSNSLNCLQVSLREYQNFEYLTINLQCYMPVLLLIISRPIKYNSEFINDFSDLISNVCTDYSKIIISGDFNIYLDNSTAPTTVYFNELLQSS